MTLTILAAVLAIAVLPLVLKRFWTVSRQVVYQGAATAIKHGFEDLGQKTKTRYLCFSVEGNSYLAEVTPDRYNQINTGDTATITVVKYPFCSAETETITLVGETANQPTVKGTGEALMFSALYFFAAMGVLIFGTGQQDAVPVQVVTYASAFLFALCGFSFNMLQTPKMNLKEVSGSMLGIPLGKGMVSLVVMLAIAAALTFFCFNAVSILTLFPGIHAAFALGSLTAILWKSRQTT